MIRIIYDSKFIKVKFDYDPSMVTIMRMFQGCYFAKDKSWSIPVERADDLIEELVVRNYDVVEVNKDNWKVLPPKEE